MVPVGTQGFKMRICPLYSRRFVKGHYIGRFLGITVKRVARVDSWTGTFKDPTKCLWHWEYDRRLNFFSPHVHLCAV